MQITSHSASRGLTWLTAGIRILMRQPAGLLMLTLIHFLVILLPAALPAVGKTISAAMIPVMYLGLMHAVRETERGETPNPAMLFVAFQAESNGIWKKLMFLGLISGACTMVMVFLAQGIAPAPPESALISPGAAQELSSEKLRDSIERTWPTLMSGMIIVGLFTLPVQMAFWYSPMFVGWHRAEIGKAIFFSIAAVWRNRGAFATLLLGWLAIVMALVIVLALLVTAFGLPISLVSIVLWLLSLILSAGAYCSFWVTYRDVVQDDAAISD